MSDEKNTKYPEDMDDLLTFQQYLTRREELFSGLLDRQHVGVYASCWRREVVKPGDDYTVQIKSSADGDMSVIISDILFAEKLDPETMSGEELCDILSQYYLRTSENEKTLIVRHRTHTAETAYAANKSASEEFKANLRGLRRFVEGENEKKIKEARDLLASLKA